MKELDGKCVCFKAMELREDECVYRYFYLKIDVMANYSIVLKFNEEIEGDFDISLLKFYLSGKSIEVFMEKKDDKEFWIEMKKKYFFNVSTEFSISIKAPLYSIKNSILEKYQYSGNLPASPKTAFSKAVKSAIKGVMSTTFATAMVSNPASCWILLNTLQIIIYLPLSPINFSVNILEFLQSIAGYSVLPNIMEFIFDTDSSSKPIDRFKRVGLKSSVFLINFGQSLFVLIVNIGIFPLILIGARLPYVSEICTQLMKNYRYNLFIRFWIETYLELGLFSLIQIQSV